MAAIRLAIGVTIHTGDSVAVPAPSFAEYEREVRLQGGKPTFIAEDSMLTVDPGDYSLVILCQPNNPTGRLYDTHAIREFAAECRETDTVLLVDEAFLDFTTQPSIAGTDGVIVARSLTKMFGLPGLRIGFAVGTGRLRDALYAARLPWNLGAPGIAVGTHCLGQSEFVTETRNRVRSERARIHDRLVPRFGITESHGPFLLLSVRHRDVRSLIDGVRNRGIAIRDATTFRGLDRHVRVAVRVPVENDQLLEALGDV